MLTIMVMAMVVKINYSQRELSTRIRSRMSSVPLLQQVASHHASAMLHTVINNRSQKSTTQRPKQPTIVNTATMVTNIMAEKYWLKNKRVQLPARYLESKSQLPMKVDKRSVITTSHLQHMLIPITNLSMWPSRQRSESKRAIPNIRRTLILTLVVILYTLQARKMALILLRPTRVLQWTSTCAMS